MNPKSNPIRKSVSYGSIPLQTLSPIVSYPPNVDGTEPSLENKCDIPSSSSSNVIVFSTILPFPNETKGEYTQTQEISTSDLCAISIYSSNEKQKQSVSSSNGNTTRTCTDGYQWTYIVCCIPVRMFRCVRRYKIELINYLMSIFLHVVLMIIFEIYFYFNYVIVIEKEIFTQKINAYFNDLVQYNHNKYSPLLLNLLLDDTDIHALDQQLYTRYIAATQQQQALLAQLFYQSCRIAATFAIVFLSLFVLGILHFRQIKWKWIVLENIIMLGLLGCFEYIFFTTIILKYNPISDAEVQYLIVHRMAEYLGSNATHRNVSFPTPMPVPIPISYATYPPSLSLMLE